MHFITKILPSPGYTSEWLYLYEAIDFKEVEDALSCDEDEFIDVIKMDLEEAYQHVLMEQSLMQKQSLRLCLHIKKRFYKTSKAFLNTHYTKNTNKYSQNCSNHNITHIMHKKIQT